MDWKKKLKETAKQVGYVRLILLAVCGIFLLYVSLPIEKESEKIEIKENISNTSGNENDLYVKKMEQRLEEILGELKGAGKVNVMITLSASRETVVEKDETWEESSEKENGDSQKETYSLIKKEETLLSDEDGDQAPYVVKTLAPMVEGILVVMEGGDDASLAEEVTEAVQALFPVDAHKIKVLKMEDGS